jgi:subtilisin family serine protease
MKNFLFNLFGIKQKRYLSYHKFLDITSFPPRSHHVRDGVDYPTGYRDWSIRHGGFNNFKYTGKGERIGIIDTGADVKHHELKGIVDNFNFVKNDSQEIQSAHGTFCCGEVVCRDKDFGVIGVAPQSTCFSSKVLTGTPSDRLVDIDKNITDAIRASVKEGCGVISMSLGGPSKSKSILDAVEFAVANGVIVFAAAGNEALEGSPYASYPASYHNVISIGSTDESDLPAWFSTKGHPYLDKYQQPEFTISSLEYYWGIYPQNKYSKMIGTSMACPMAAGVALLWLEAHRANKTLPTGYDRIIKFREWVKEIGLKNQGKWNNETGWGPLKLNVGDLP